MSSRRLHLTIGVREKADEARDACPPEQSAMEIKVFNGLVITAVRENQDT